MDEKRYFGWINQATIKNNIFLNFVLLLFVTTLSAQQFVIDGEVFHATHEDLDNIHIYNKSTTKGTLTNRIGEFRLSVTMGDTLVVSSVQFKTVSVVVSLEHMVTKKIKVELMDSTTELDEIFLRNHNLTGDLLKDAASIKTQHVPSPLSLGIINKEIKPLTASESHLFTAQSGFLDPLINAISGRTKMLKKRVETDRSHRKLEAFRERLPIDYWEVELGIAPDMLHDFLYFCEADPEYNEIVKKDGLSIREFLMRKAEEYKNLQATEGG